jgi:flagellin-specific chaperone FliS
MAAEKAKSREKSSEKAAGGDLSHSVRELMKSFSEQLQKATFEAQQRQTEAAYAYWDALDSALRQSSSSALTAQAEELRKSWQQNDSAAYLEAQRRYWEAVREAQVAAQEDVQEALKQYNERVQGVVNDLGSQLNEKNASLARSLTDVLAKAEVTAADVPVLAALCNAMAYRANSGGR